MNTPQPSTRVPVHVRRRLALWVGVAALVGGAVGYFTGHSARQVIGGALSGAAAVLLISWIDHLIDWAQRVLRVMRATLIGLSCGAIGGVLVAMVRKEKWLGPMFGGAAIGAILAMFLWIMVERRRAKQAQLAREAATRSAGPSMPAPPATTPKA